MAKTVADGLWEMLVAAGVQRCYGIVGDALNPTVDAMRRNGSVAFVHVRHEEFGVFAAVAEASLITEVERRTPVVHIILNNSRLDFVDIEQQEAGLLPYGTNMVNPDFSRVAEALGATGIRIEDPATVRDGLAAALANRAGPTVVDVVVDKHALSMPAHVPAETVKGFTLSLAKQLWAGRGSEVIPTITHNVRLV